MAAASEPAYRTAFRKLLRGRDMVDFTPEEREAVERYRKAEDVRTMAEGTGALGGFGVPFDLDPSMNLVSDGAQSPIRQLARRSTRCSRSEGYYPHGLVFRNKSGGQLTAPTLTRTGKRSGRGAGSTVTSTPPASTTASGT